MILSLVSLLTFAVALGSVEYNHNEAFEGVFTSKYEYEFKSVPSKSSNKDPQAILARKEDPIHKQALARRERNAKLASDKSFRKAEFENTVQDLTKSRQENHEQHLKQVTEHATRLKAHFKRSQSEESLLSPPATPLAQPSPSMYYVASQCQSLGGDYYPLSGSFYPLGYCFVSSSGSFKYFSYDVALSTIYYSSVDCSGPIYYYSNSSSYPTTPCGPSNSYYSASVVSAANVPTGLITSYYTQNSTNAYQCSQPESYGFQVNTCTFSGCSSYSTICSTNVATGDVISTYSSYSSNTCQGTPYYSTPTPYTPNTCDTNSYATYSCTSSTVDFNNFNSQMSFPTMSPSVMPSTQEYYVKTESYYNSYTNYTTYQSGTYYPLTACIPYSSSQSFQYVTIEQYGYSSLYELYYCSADCSGPVSSTTQMYNYSNTPMVDLYFSAVVEEASLPQGYLSYNLQYNYTSGDYGCAFPESVDFVQGCISYGTSSYQYQCGFDQGDIVQITNSYSNSTTCSGNVSSYSTSYSTHTTCSPSSYYYYTCSNPILILTTPPTPSPTLSPTTLSPTSSPTFSSTSSPTLSPNSSPTLSPTISISKLLNYSFIGWLFFGLFSLVLNVNGAVVLYIRSIFREILQEKLDSFQNSMPIILIGSCSVAFTLYVLIFTSIEIEQFYLLTFSKIISFLFWMIILRILFSGDSSLSLFTMLREVKQGTREFQSIPTIMLLCKPAINPNSIYFTPWVTWMLVCSLNLAFFRFLPWFPTPTCVVLNGYPNLLIARLCLYPSLISICLQAIVSIKLYLESLSTVKLVYCIFSILDFLYQISSTFLFLRLGETADHSIMIVDSAELDNFTEILANFEQFKNVLQTTDGTQNPIQKEIDPEDNGPGINRSSILELSQLGVQNDDSSLASKKFGADTEFADENVEFLKYQLKKRNLKPLPFIPLPQLKQELAEMMRKIQEGEEIDEGRFEILSECLSLSPEHQAELIEQERKWMADNRKRIEQALETMKAFISTGIFVTSQQTYMEQTGYPKKLVNRLYFKKCLWLVRMQPSDIARLHHSDLTTKYNPEGQGLDLTETLGILGQILKVNFQNDPGNKKEQWKQKLIETSRKLTDQYDRGILPKNQVRHPCYLGQSGIFLDEVEMYSLPTPEVVKELSLDDISMLRRSEAMDSTSTHHISSSTFPMKSSSESSPPPSLSPSPSPTRSPQINLMASALSAALEKRKNQIQ